MIRLGLSYMFDVDQIELKAEEIKKIFKVSRVLNSNLDLETVVSQVLDLSMEVIGTEAGTLWLITEDGEHLEPAVARGPRADALKGLKLRRGEGLAGQVADTREPVLIEDVTKDDRWAKRFDQSTGFVTRSMMVVPLLAKDRSIGSLQVINKVSGELFTPYDLKFARVLTAQSADIIENARVYTYQNQFLQTMLAQLAGAMDERDGNNKGHSERVKKYALMIAREMGMTEQEKLVIERAAYFHDLGKIGIPDSVLNSAGPMDLRSAEIAKKHPTIGARILSQMEPKAVVRQIWAGAMYHHERYDGSGYPTGLAEDDIPVVARIIAIANYFDELTTDKIYRKSISAADALTRIEQEAGKGFDPYLSELFISAMRKYAKDEESES